MPAAGRCSSPTRRLAETTFLGDLLRRETVGGAIALVAAAVAVVWANSPWGASYDACGTSTVGPLDLEHWAADGALTLFFFVAGLELKREFVVGSLRRPADAAVPVVAALCGVAVPALIYLVVNSRAADGEPGGLGDPGRDRHRLRAGGAGRGRLQPADGAAGLPADPRGRRRPGGHRDHRRLLHRRRCTSSRCWARVVGLRRLGAAPATAGSARRGSTCRSRSSAWWLVHESGVHATIAGMVARSADPGPPRPRRVERSPAERLEHLLSPISSGGGRPVLRAAVGRRRARRRAPACSSDPVVIGVVLGLVVGKPIGVFGGHLGWSPGSPTPSLAPVAELARHRRGRRSSPASASPSRCSSPTSRFEGETP